jgi:hypothetical protein
MHLLLHRMAGRETMSPDNFAVERGKKQLQLPQQT